jgi:hypothetical protein
MAGAVPVAVQLRPAAGCHFGDLGFIAGQGLPQEGQACPGSRAGKNFDIVALGHDVSNNLRKIRGFVLFLSV